MRIASAWVGGVLVAAFFALFIWPTAYRTIPMVSMPGTGVFAARENRFTGRVELLTRKGWQPAYTDLYDEYRSKAQT